MSIYTLEKKQFIKSDLDSVWAFFSTPKNLKTLTPSEMNFEIIRISKDMGAYAGQMIEYRVTVLPGVRIKWLTEITHVQTRSFFVDEQRVGPYAIWHHEHHFVEKDGGVEMTDIITYRIPFGILGDLLSPMIGKRLKRIFDFRYDQTEKIFAETERAVSLLQE